MLRKVFDLSTQASSSTASATTGQNNRCRVTAPAELMTVLMTALRSR